MKHAVFTMFYAMPKEPAPRGARGRPRTPHAIQEVLCKARSANRLEHPTILWTKLVQTCSPVLRRPRTEFYMWIRTATESRSR